MANIVPNSFKSGLLKGTFNFDTSGNGGNAFKCALYTSYIRLQYSINCIIQQVMKLVHQEHLTQLVVMR